MGNMVIAKRVVGLGAVEGGSVSKVIHLLDHILVCRRVCWAISVGMLTSMHGAQAVHAGFGGGGKIQGGALGDTSVVMAARVAARMSLGRT